jgi:hypothetical protein
MPAEIEKILEVEEIKPEPPQREARESAVKEKPIEVQQEEIKGPISNEQWDQIYGLLPDFKLTMQQCVGAMKKLGHSGPPRQFPAAKFQALVDALEKMRKR